MDAREREEFLAAVRIAVISINRTNPTTPLATPVWYHRPAATSPC
jgi:hypothetical protein